MDTASNPVAARPARTDKFTVLNLIDRAESHPTEVRAAALELLDGAMSDEVICLGERAVGLAERYLGNLPAACHHLRRSAEFGRLIGADSRAASESLACLATTLAMAGDLVEALRVSTEVVRFSPLTATAPLLHQRALILQRLDRTSEALQCFSDAFGAVSASTHPDITVSIFNNRGTLYASMGDFVAAEADLRSALSVMRRTQAIPDDSVLLHNLGVVLSRQGRVLDALALFSEVDHKVAATRTNNTEMTIDRAELYLQARLLREAEGAARRSVALATVDSPVVLPETLLLLARVHCAAGQFADARTEALKARDSFELQGRVNSAHFADQLVGLLESPVRSIERPIIESTRISDELGPPDVPKTWNEGALIEAALSRATANEAELTPNDREHLLILATTGVRSTNSITKIQASCATAMLALQHHDVPGTRRALKETIRHLTHHFSSLSAIELRVLALDAIAPLEALIVALVAETGVAGDLVRWTELARSAIRRVDPSVASLRSTERVETDIAAVSAEMRKVTDQLASLQPVGPEVADLLRRRSALEWQLRMTSWLAPNDHMSAPTSPARIGRKLNSPVYLVFAASNQHLTCVVRGDGRDRLAQLAPLSHAAPELQALRFAHSRVLAASDDSANYEALDRATLRLQHLVLPPIADSDRPVVIVPTGLLAAVPWSLLPALRQREVSLSISLSDSVATNPLESRSRALIVAGPGLAHAVAEIESIAALYRDPIVLVGETASSAEVTRALEGVDVLHVAAHGSPRPDNAFLSAIQLVDGPFSSYDLQRVGRTPRTVILSCCDLGAAVSNPSWTMVGIASTLCNHGTAEVVMSVLPVSDESSLKFMETVHRDLVAGSSARSALLTATAASFDPLVRITGQSFLTMGAPSLVA